MADFEGIFRDCQGIPIIIPGELVKREGEKRLLEMAKRNGYGYWATMPVQGDMHFEPRERKEKPWNWSGHDR